MNKAARESIKPEESYKDGVPLLYTGYNNLPVLLNSNKL